MGEKKIDRIPSSSFVKMKSSPIFAHAQINGLVVQLVRIPACHAGGREFESRPDRKQKHHESGAFFVSRDLLLLPLPITTRLFFKTVQISSA